MHAQPGDRIVVRNRTIGGPVRDAEVLEVKHEDGSPPYRVRWSDNGHEGFFFPGEDAHIDHAGPDIPHGGDLVWRKDSAQSRPGSRTHPSRAGRPEPSAGD